MIRKYAEIFCWKNVSSFCNAKVTHIFSAKNIRILYIESAKIVNEMTLNELVKLTTLWTTGPRCPDRKIMFEFQQDIFSGRKKCTSISGLLKAKYIYYLCVYALSLLKKSFATNSWYLMPELETYFRFILLLSILWMLGKAFSWHHSGPSSSKVTISLVNVSLKLWSLNVAYTLIFLLKKCEQLLHFTFFSPKIPVN